MQEQFKAIDFFCGGGGMTCGLRQAGIEVIAGVDFDATVGATYEYNNSGSKFVCADIKRLRSDYFEKIFHVQRNDNHLIMVGCSPCQYYSIINHDTTKSELSKNLLRSFARFIDYYRPGYVLVENVPGIVTNKDSILPEFLKKLDKCGYKDVIREIVNMSEYGVPQSRRRFSLIATRIDGVKLHLPIKENRVSVLADVLGVEHGFPKICAGHRDNTAFAHTAAGLSPKGLKRMQKTRHDGGSRLDWADDAELQLKCFIAHDDSFKDTYGRMWWDKPAPTITTKFFSISNGRFGHPEEDRAISIREGATIQTFPKDYVFKTSSIATAARIIGNAVPPEYAKRLGETILKKQ